MKKTAYRWKKICSVCLSAVLVFQAAVFGSMKVVGEGGSDAADKPSLNFQNEKYEGIQVSKNIYSHEEYVKGAGNREPLREADPLPDGTYAVNELKYDEFRMALYGGKQRESLFHTSTSSPLKHIPFQRKTDNLLYYNIRNNKTVDGKNYDLILAPVDINDYYLYYSEGDGTIRIMFRSQDSHYASEELKNSDDPVEQELYDTYMSLNYYEKFMMDGPWYDYSDDPVESECFKYYERVSSKFYTDSQDGSFFIFDGDVTYFEKEVFTDEINYVRVREKWEHLKELNEKRQKRENKNYSGEYFYMIGDDVVTEVASALQGNVLEVANRFGKPVNELEVSKTVPYFGLAQSDINLFRTTDRFEYKILINEEVPESLQYTIFDTKTNETKPAAPPEGEELPDNVIEADGSYHYVTTNGVFYLYAEETAVFYGLNNNDKVEIREYTDPDHYSVYDNSLVEGAEFRYVRAEDSSETPKRDYASMTVTYGNEQNQRRNPTFMNVPNVLQVRKELDNLKHDDDRSFEFTIRKLLPDPQNPDKPYEYDGEYIVNSEFVRDENGDPVVIRDENNDPEQDSSGNLHYQTEPVQLAFNYYLRNGYDNYDSQRYNAENGVFSLKDDQTAMFVDLKADTMYLVSESNTPAYQLQGKNPRVLRTRKETVDDSHIRSRSSREYELFINERSEMKGLILTKIVRDSDNRLNKNAEYTFRIEKYENDQYVPLKNTDYQYKNGTDNYETAKTDQNGYLRVRYNKDHFIVRFPQASGKYRVTEVDPNDFDDQNNAIGEKAPNPGWEDHLYVTDVKHTEYIINSDQTATAVLENQQVFNDNKEEPTRNIVIGNINCNISRAAELIFTNSLREKKYFFDIEKFAYVDDNVHKEQPDSSQRFCFRVERFDTMAHALSGSDPLETFYTDVSCNEKMNITNSGTAENPDYRCTFSSGQNYSYAFYPIDTPFSELTASAKFQDNTVSRTYKKRNTAPVYHQNETEEYIFPTSVYRGCRQIAVKKQGFYRISEVTEWSNTDYDYCTGSNRYKGYLDKTFQSEMWGDPEESKYNIARNKLFADYETTHETGYDSSDGVLEHGVIIFVGMTEDKSSLNTLSCDSFDEERATVFFNCSESGDQFIQKRDENGSLLYYVSGSSGEVTDEKYNSDGTVREGVLAPLSEFRIQKKTSGESGKLLYYDNGQAEPVYEYAVTPEGENLAKFELSDENTPVSFPVYNENGEQVEGITAYRLKPEYRADETLYAHTSQVWRSERVTTYSYQNALRPTASFSNVESEFAILSDNAWADNILKRAQ